jgi:hypothetical protein
MNRLLPSNQARCKVRRLNAAQSAAEDLAEGWGEAGQSSLGRLLLTWPPRTPRRAIKSVSGSCALGRVVFPAATVWAQGRDDATYQAKADLDERLPIEPTAQSVSGSCACGRNFCSVTTLQAQDEDKMAVTAALARFVTKPMPNPSIERTSTGLARSTSLVYVPLRGPSRWRPAHVKR